VDDKDQYGVAHSESYYDEKKRERFSVSSVPSKKGVTHNKTSKDE